jgi:hypothetical protein
MACPVRAKASMIALFLCGAGYAVVVREDPHRPEKNRGRAGRQGSNGTHGPRRLATSRLVEVLCARRSPWFARSARQSASPPKPWASRARCLVGLLREGPRGRPFTRLSATTVEDQAFGRRPSDGDPGTGHQGPRRIARSAGSFAAWTAGPSHSASPLQGHPPGHRLPPRVWRR